MADSDNEELTIADEKVVKKYKKAAEITNDVLQKVIEKCVAGAVVLDLCKFGDESLETGTAGCYNTKKKDDKERIKKGIAFPTCICINHCVCHFSPLTNDTPVVLKDGDLVKIDLGCHIDGFIAVAAHTIVVGATADNPVTGRMADAVLAAYQAGEIALRLLKPKTENNVITDHVQKIAESYECKPIEGMLSHQLKQHIIDGEKAIIQNPSVGQKREHEKCEFDLNEVYAMDVLVSTGVGKGKEGDAKTTVYKQNDSVMYNVKLKASRQLVSDVNKKSGCMPFSLRMMPHEVKAKMGVTECMKHGKMEPFQVLFEKQGEFVAQFKYTVLLMSEGPRKITGLPFEKDLYKSEHSVKDEKLAALLSENVDFKTAEERRTEAAAQAMADITAEMAKATTAP